MARKGRKSIFAYEPKVYTPSGGRKSLTPAEAKKEYSRLRSIAMKRLKALEGTEYEPLDVDAARERFRPVKKISSGEIYGQLSDIAYWLKNPVTTLSGAKSARKKQLSTLHAHGYSGVTAENYQDFARYMQNLRAAQGGKLYDSERAAEAFEEAYEEALDTDAGELALKKYDKWVELDRRERAAIEAIFGKW